MPSLRAQIAQCYSLVEAGFSFVASHSAWFLWSRWSLRLHVLCFLLDLRCFQKPFWPIDSEMRIFLNVDLAIFSLVFDRWNCCRHVDET